MHTLFQKIASLLVAPSLIVLGWAGYTIPRTDAPQISPNAPIAEVYDTPVNVGASLAIETPVALFTTSLTNSITAAATSMTLVSATTLDGTSLSSSTYSFILDEGTASQEFVKADCTSTTCTNMQRGISTITGTSTVAALTKNHRKGASVKITDAPLLLNLTRIVNGTGTLPNILSYTTHPTFTSNTQLVDLQQLNATAFGSVPVVVASGGTGQTSLPTNMLLVGNGTSGVLSTSSPTVTSITATSTTAVNTIAGTLNVTGNTNLLSQTNIIASSTQYIENVGTINATSTIRATSFVGSGASLTNIAVPHYSFATTSLIQADSNLYATTSAITIPAGVMTASSTISVKMSFRCAFTGSATCRFYVVSGTGVPFWTFSINQGVSSSAYCSVDLLILPNYLVTSQTTTSSGSCISSDATVPSTSLQNIFATTAVNLSNAFSIAGKTFTAGSTATGYINDLSVVVNP